MSCCEVSGTNEHIPSTGCCESKCSSGKKGSLASEPRIRSGVCQTNVGCLYRADCGGFCPKGTAATGACPGPCQCDEEEAWNINIPPKPNCEWLSNFSELRRQWSDHSRPQNCKCCNCRPRRKAAPCKPCSRTTSSLFGNTGSSKNNQDCCKERMSGGGCELGSKKTSSSSGSPLPNHNSQNHIFEINSSSRECPQPSPPICQVPSSCQPCSPSPRPILKKSCCQCIPGYCMCQPLPRNCNCPPPVHIDARANRECSCDCPSPECACPPSERRFPRTKIRCPNAKLCYPFPRLPPIPKRFCSKCQPCLPPPCDPCTTNKCKTIPTKMKPYQADSTCPTLAPCPPRLPKNSSRLPYPHTSRDIPPSTSFRQMSSTYDEPLQSQVRFVNRPRSSHSGPGQYLGPDDATDGDEDGVAESVKSSQQNCSFAGQGCETVCNFCCLKDADDVGVTKEDVKFKLNWDLSTRESLKEEVKFVNNISSVPPKAQSASLKKEKPTSSVTNENNSCQYSTTAATLAKKIQKSCLFDRLQAQTKRLNPFLKINKLLVHQE